jgi:hypothetical protein
LGFIVLIDRIFQAFRFPSTPTVNFVATVQFCQDLCQPITCSGNLGKQTVSQSPSQKTLASRLAANHLLRKPW